VDKPRPSQARRKLIRRILFTTVALLAGSAVTLGLYRLEPAAPRVDGNTLYAGTVQRGEMVREVRGLGRLVPEDIRWITSETSGTVEQILAQPGIAVSPNTVLVELSSPELEQQTLDSGYDLEAAEDEHRNLVIRLENDVISQQDAVASADLDLELAETDYTNEQALFDEGLTDANTLNSRRVAFLRAQQRRDASLRQLETMRQSNEGTLAASTARLNQRRGGYQLKLDELDALVVRAGVSGVLQQLSLEVGQNIGSGANVARVADPARLKAELDINESQVGDVLLGQKVVVDFRPEKIRGTVVRIDPSVTGGVVKVDVRFEDPLPPNARPDQSVDGLIEIERLDDALYISPRPSIGGPNSTVGVFVIQENEEAVRRVVRLGRASANSVEVLEGLNEGEQVILTDMSQWDEFDRVRLDY
jgi:HlyD family secretion protein